MRKLIVATLLALLMVAMLPAQPAMAITTSYNSGTGNGYVQASNAVYAAAQGAVSGTATIGGGTLILGQSYYAGSTYYVNRVYLYIDTSGIPDGATITAATLYITPFSDYSATDFNITVTNGQPTYPHSPLVGSDFNKTYYSGNGGSLTTAGLPLNVADGITLNATGISWISKTGTTKFCLQSSRDISASAPSAISDEYIFLSSAAAATYLSVTYSAAAAPTITADAATSVADTTAILNGTIDDDGGDPAAVQVSWGYGTTSHTSADFALYDTVTAFAGTYSTGDTPHNDLAGLTAGQTYYFRFQAKNSAGTTTSDELSFTTQNTPTITAKDASNIAVTTARLNGSVDDDGELTVEVRWGYGTTSHTSGDFALYDTVTAWAGAYTTGQSPYLDVSGLTDTTTYYFRFQAKNAIGTVTSGEIDFDTLSSLNEPTNLILVPFATSIQATWQKGVGSTNTLVRYSLSAYPATTADGLLAYFGAASTYNLTGLMAGKTYYFSLWGEDAGSYSAAATNGMITTSAGAATTTTPAVTGIARFFTAPDYTNMQHLPLGLYDGINGVADTLSMPRETLWMMVALGLAGVGGVSTYVAAKSAAIGMITGLGILAWGWAAEIVPGWILVIDIIAVIAIIRMGTETER